MNLSKFSNLKEQSSILFDQGIVSGVNFLNGILLARYLGIESFGEYAFIWMIVLFFSSIQQALFVMPFVYFTFQKNSQSYNSLYIFTQLVFSIFSIICTVLGLSLYYYITDGIIFNSNQFLSIGILIFSFLLFDFIRKYLIALRKLKQVLIIDGITYSTQIGVIFSLYILEINVSLYSVFWILSSIYTFGYILGLLSSNVVKIRFKDYKGDLLEIWTYSKWLVSSSLMTFSSTNMFFMFCGIFLGATSLGAVRATQNLMGIFNVLGQFIENFLPVKLAQFFGRGQMNEINNYLLRTGSIVIFLLFIFLLFSLFFSEYIYEIVYGPDFKNFSFLLNWFIVTYIFFFINNFVRYGLRTIGATKPIFYSYVINTVISLISVYPLLKYFELDGLIFGLLLTQLTSIFYLLKRYKKELKIKAFNGHRHRERATTKDVLV